jgi:hypothetical protein
MVAVPSAFGMGFTVTLCCVGPCCVGVGGGCAHVGQLALLSHERAVALEPHNPLILNNYGYAYELAGMLPQALEVRVDGSRV